MSKATNRALVPLMLALAHLSIGCGKADVSGEWELVSPETGLALGDVLTISGDGTWKKTGFPAYSGSYEWKDGKLVLYIETLDGQTRAEAARSLQGNDDALKLHERRMKEQDAQMVFIVDDSDGVAVLRQSDPDAAMAELRFRKRED